MGLFIEPSSPMIYICLIQEVYMQTKMKLNGGNWGGLRSNAGRKRIRSRGVSHSVRELVSHRTPMHVNFKYRLPVRNKETLKLLKRSIQNARKHGLRVMQYSFQKNHIHLILEAESNPVLTKGMRSLTITFAKGLKQGRIQLERYHLHVLRTAREVKHAVHYVLFNQQKHESGTYSKMDEYSSVLFLANGLELIRKFAKMKAMTIKIKKGDFWESDEGRSYLYISAMKHC